MRVTSTSALALIISLGLGGAAMAQGTEAPAGQAPATAPGGTEGADGQANVQRAIREGDAVGVQPNSPAPPQRRPVEQPPQRR